MTQRKTETDKQTEREKETDRQIKRQWPRQKNKVRDRQAGE